MSIDPRLIEIERTAEGREPTEVAADQVAVIFDNLIVGYLADPETTDAALRRDGLAKSADRLVELFGAGWWTKVQR